MLNLDIVNFRNHEKLINKYVSVMKIALRTLELNNEGFTKLFEMSQEGSIKMAWEVTDQPTKASVLEGDSQSEITERMGVLFKVQFVSEG